MRECWITLDLGTYKQKHGEYPKTLDSLEMAEALLPTTPQAPSRADRSFTNGSLWVAPSNFGVSDPTQKTTSPFLRSIQRFYDSGDILLSF